MRRHAAAGFTLLELMLTLGVGSLLGAATYGIMFMQTTSFLDRMDEFDLHHNGRAAMSVVRRLLQQTGYGMGQHPEAQGVSAIGQCMLRGDAPLLASNACNRVASDGGADRLRSLSVAADAYTSRYSQTPSNQQCDLSGTGPLNVINTQQAVPLPLSTTRLLAIGGDCEGGDVTAASDLLTLRRDTPGNGCLHRYEVVDASSGAATLSCPQGYSPNFTFGYANLADLFIRSMSDGTPCLMLAQDPTAAPQVVAFNVEDLQVRYGINLTMPASASADTWCDDPRPASAGGTCPAQSVPPGTVFDASDLRNRIVAVRVALRLRSDRARAGRAASPLDPSWLGDNPVDNPTDGSLRRLLVTTVQLRNGYHL